VRRVVNIWNSLDKLSVLIYIVLVFLGWINIYAAVYNDEHGSIFDISQQYGKQLIWIGAAFAIATLFFLIDTRFYSVFAYIIYGIIVMLLISVLFLGTEVNGARSWFDIGGFRVQPSEFGKFAANLALAKYLSSFNLKIRNFTTLIFVMLILLVPAGLIMLQNDTGSALVYSAFVLVLYREGLSGTYLLVGVLLLVLFIITLMIDLNTIVASIIVLTFILFWITRQRNKELGVSFGIFTGISFIIWAVDYFTRLEIPLYNILLLAIVLSGPIYYFLTHKYKIKNVYLLYFILIGVIVFTYSVDYGFNNILESHQQERINELLGKESNPLGAGYNVNQSKIAIGSGGFFGKGFLEGTQTKYNFVPEQSTDFIFCTVGEEWGFFGTFVVLCLFLGLLLRIIFLAERQRSVFSRVYGYGVASILFFHIAVNVGMTIGLAPVIGIPLPFFSYGGSSLWSFTILLFIFLRLDASRFELMGQ